ncbi:hypothetical protein [Paenibacillus apiarius]|uniref:Uncharacterized protein n=1 Tax=Paenibacillus apiarius TaxID=46240 RepID=A0ABT4DX97_9BACL|nr:hypothetical protein [Paenibacillus apiarius]MCY9513256.1 hypothetical protein [Paenibacillus apiarius]MCY9521385.1 hypothetical protein [Paenibacillus apiarius]MCY9554469.1 hypothetical protein [Paenibacillus apiarius]MCY9560672.1 hypothetical protein [Paenibacillus apiarius]MCY9685077.1 hypothetical protein [Paenibacillus apiarius]
MIQQTRKDKHSKRKWLQQMKTLFVALLKIINILLAVKGIPDFVETMKNLIVL